MSVRIVIVLYLQSSHCKNNTSSGSFSELKECKHNILKWKQLTVSNYSSLPATTKEDEHKLKNQLLLQNNKKRKCYFKFFFQSNQDIKLLDEELEQRIEN